MSRAHRVLALALLLLAALFASGFRDRLGLAVFAGGPPVLLAMAVLLRLRGAALWAGIFALGWFSYGVMEAWTLAGHARVYALAIVALALLVVGAASWNGMTARFGRNARR